MRGEFNNFDVVGVQRGFQGLIEGCFEQLEIRSVSNILGHGGTFLRSARSPDFLDNKNRPLSIEDTKNYVEKRLIENTR